MVKLERERKKIIEFLDLVDNGNYAIRKYNRPAIVWEVDGNVIKYTLWENNILEQIGIENIIGWDYKEDKIYAPDWALEDDEFDEDLIDDFDDRLDKELED
ncbi:MAG: hypothetical protein U9N34_04745 [Candidatus Cloacimonadota bacterium]|nr:hypothetical protein [Candidatus Cloacimonadota bacterium]